MPRLNCSCHRTGRTPEDGATREPFGAIDRGFCCLQHHLGTLFGPSPHVCFGGINLRYAMTIGLDITSMGFGALMLDPVVTRLRSGRQHDGPEGVAAFAQRLFVIECLLMMCGLLAVPFVLWCDRLDLTLMMGSVLGGYLKVMVLHFPIVVIGILSGLELPLLMSCAKPLRDGSKDATVPPSSSSFDSGTLAWDYVGTVGGALLFPFFLLPRFGVFGVAGLVVLSNAATTLLSWLSCSITHI